MNSVAKEDYPSVASSVWVGRSSQVRFRCVSIFSQVCGFYIRVEKRLSGSGCLSLEHDAVSLSVNVPLGWNPAARFWWKCRTHFSCLYLRGLIPLPPVSARLWSSVTKKCPRMQFFFLLFFVLSRPDVCFYVCIVAGDVAAECTRSVSGSSKCTRDHLVNILLEVQIVVYAKWWNSQPRAAWGITFLKKMQGMFRNKDVLINELVIT